MRQFAEDLRETLSTELFTIGGTEVSLASFVYLAVVLAAFYVASLVLRRVLDSWLLRRFELDSGVRYAVERVLQYAVVAVGVTLAFSFVGIDLSRLGLLLGLLSVGIGFGLQNITSNFISGLILLVERPVTIGDRVSVGDTEGDIVSINIRSTVVRSLSNVSIIVPNSDLISNNVINWSHGDRRIRVSVLVGVAYGSDIDAVTDSLVAAAREHDDVLASPPPRVRLNDFGDSAWNMELLVWLPDAAVWRDTRSDLNVAIVRKFRERGVEIPFPQRDLHLRSPLPVPVTSGDPT